MPKDMGSLSIVHVCIWDIVCPKPCSCLCVSPSSPVLWYLPLSWLERVVVYTGFQIAKTLSLPRVNTSPLSGPQVTCLPKISWSLGIVLLGFGLFEGSAHVFHFPWALGTVGSMQYPPDFQSPCQLLYCLSYKCQSIVQPYVQRHSISGDNVFQEPWFILLVSQFR